MSSRRRVGNTVARTLRTTGVPGDRSSEARAWRVVRAAYHAEPVAAPRHSRRRLLVAPVAAVLAAVLTLSPAGATVSRVIERAFGTQRRIAVMPRPVTAMSLPEGGELLASGTGGSWLVARDGTVTRLGPWRQASWSPHGLYVAVASGDLMAAVNPQGIVEWALRRPRVSDPRWYSPSGYRIAYLSGRELRVVAGDSTGDHLLARAVMPVAPAWRPESAYELAYSPRAAVVAIRAADTGRLLWTARAPGPVRKLQWSADGGVLLVQAAHGLRLFAADGRPLGTLMASAGAPVRDAALSPDGRTVAIVRGGQAEDVVTVSVRAPHRLRHVLVTQGIAQAMWAPDGRWLLLTWPLADEWIFVRVAGQTGPAGQAGLSAVSQVAGHFLGRAAPAGFPRLDGWCCTQEGTAG